MTRLLYLQAAEPDAGRPSRYTIGKLPAVIGRQSGCEVCINLDRISRRHASLEAQGSGYVLTDLGSTNGTFVNHEKVTESVPVIPGDTIHLADHEFALWESEEGEAEGLANPETGRMTDRPTLMGFTAHPETFPLQAPQFYELLNDQEFEGRVRPVVDAEGHVHGNLLAGHGTHPRLSVPESQLFELAEALGEEARLARLVRSACLDAGAGGLPDQRLFVPVHAVELADPDSLVGDLDPFGDLGPDIRLVALITGDVLDTPPDLSPLSRRPGDRDWHTACRITKCEDRDVADILSLGMDYVFVDVNLLPGADGDHPGRLSTAGLKRLTDAGAHLVVTGIDSAAAAERALDAGAEYRQGVFFEH